MKPVYNMVCLQTRIYECCSRGRVKVNMNINGFCGIDTSVFYPIELFFAWIISLMAVLHTLVTLPHPHPPRPWRWGPECTRSYLHADRPWRHHTCAFPCGLIRPSLMVTSLNWSRCHKPLSTSNWNRWIQSLYLKSKIPEQVNFSPIKAQRFPTWFVFEAKYIWHLIKLELKLVIISLRWLTLLDCRWI